ncbi:ATPase, Class I, type 8B, member 2 [Anopheles sinensis]|uniref:ATPase, Class I, type 8B, member 2 n=1 Tax=Anopheles sinensis TaxID=74873 RepID=A0A084WDP2_ANOSI|nr:ATPase, Class I, type 8B, member 2 [Anopheles sinensis]
MRKESTPPGDTGFGDGEPATLWKSIKGKRLMQHKLKKTIYDGARYEHKYYHLHPDSTRKHFLNADGAEGGLIT